MTQIMQENVQQSKYLKPQREIKIFHWVAAAFFFTLYVLPQYFGIPFPLFDLTALRIMIVIVLFMMLADTKRIKDFVNLVMTEPFSKILLPYLCVITYTMVLRADINAFLNPFIEILTLYLLVYMIRSTLGVENTIRMILLFSYLITLLGIVEYGMGRSPFSYLETIKGVYTGQFVRSGSYRIMSSCNHSLGYGLMLITMTPFACYDEKKQEVNLLAHPVLLFLLAANVFLCGSRSTLSVFVLEVGIIVLLSSKQQIKKVILVGIIALIVFALVVIAIRNTSIGRYILLQITSIVDELLGTELSVQYGANVMALSSSSHYRDQLKYIFTLDWLNPLLGIGRKRSFRSEINGSFIASVDNFYIAEYIRYAYPGMIAYIVFIGSFLVGMVKRMRVDKSGLPRLLFTGALCYMINLKWVDSLQTLKYLYILFAVFVCLSPVEKKEREKAEFHSKYLKRGGAR